MDSLFSGTFDQFGSTLKAVFDGFTTSFSEIMDKMLQNFINTFSEIFAKMMTGFSEDFTNQLSGTMSKFGEDFSQQLASALGDEFSDLLASGAFEELFNSLELQINQIVSKFMLISSIPIVLALVAIVISSLSVLKIKKVALFDKRIEVYSALEFLFDYKKFANLKENERLLDKLEDNMAILNRAKFVFDESLTKSISEFSNSFYSKITTSEDIGNNSSIASEVDSFKTDYLPQIEALIKL